MGNQLFSFSEILSIVLIAFKVSFLIYIAILFYYLESGKDIMR